MILTAVSERSMRQRAFWAGIEVDRPLDDDDGIRCGWYGCGWYGRGWYGRGWYGRGWSGGLGRPRRVPREQRIRRRTLLLHGGLARTLATGLGFVRTAGLALRRRRSLRPRTRLRRRALGLRTRHRRRALGLRT